MEPAHSRYSVNGSVFFPPRIQSAAGPQPVCRGFSFPEIGAFRPCGWLVQGRQNLKLMVSHLGSLPFYTALGVFSVTAVWKSVWAVPSRFAAEFWFGFTWTDPTLNGFQADSSVWPVPSIFSRHGFLPYMSHRLVHRWLESEGSSSLALGLADGASVVPHWLVSLPCG